MASQDGEIKVIKGVQPVFIVDGFSFCRDDCKHYFLNHTTGLHASFDRGMVYCSEITAALLIHDMGISPQVVHPLPVGATATIEGVEVTPLDANHCPGAVMLHFYDARTGKRVLHVGDFRASDDLTHGKELREVLHRGPIDILYLDTTYNHPRHAFPPQSVVLGALADIARRELAREPRTAFVVGSYSIGKERAVEAVVDAVGSPALVSARKADVLAWCDRDTTKYTTVDGPSVRVYVAGAGVGTGHDGLADILRLHPERFVAAVGIRPTGWTYSPSSERKGYTPWVETCDQGETRVYTLPYSEHSSYTELQAFVKRVQPRAIIPTVNAAQRDEQVDRFVQHMDLTRDKSRIDAYLSPRGAVDPSRPYCEGSHSAKRGGKRPAQPLNVESVCVAEQRRLWELATMSRQMATDEGSGAAAAVGFFSRSKCEGSEDVNADALEQLKEMVGGPTDYLLSLLRDSHGSVELACSIHFGPNGGVVPDASSARAMMAHQGFGRRSPLCHGSTAQTGGESYEARHVRGAGCATSGVRKEHHDSENDHTDDVIIVGGNKDDDSDDGDDGDDVFPCGVVACVHGDDKAFNLFSGRELVEKRLQQLGAKLTRRKTKSTTHIITPCGVKRANVPNLPSMAVLRDEAWLFRHVRRWKAKGTADSQRCGASADGCAAGMDRDRDRDTHPRGDERLKRRRGGEVL